MPLVAAAAALTFGACDDDESVTNESLEDIGADLNRVSCEWLAECDDEFDEYFENVAACVEEFEENYTESAFDEFSDEADDPRACRGAIAEWLRCYADAYRGAGCEDLDDEDAEDLCGAAIDAADEACGDDPDWEGL